MSYADPAKRNAASARSKRKRREDPEVRAAENEARQLRRPEPKRTGATRSIAADKVVSLDTPSGRREVDALALARWTEASGQALFEFQEGDAYDHEPPD